MTRSVWEIVRLPVEAGREEEVAAFLAGASYFTQPGFLEYRVLRGVEEPEFAIVFHWASREASMAAIQSTVGQEFLEGLSKLLSGPPAITYYDSDQHGRAASAPAGALASQLLNAQTGR